MIQIAGFHGEMPSVDVRALPDQSATVAQNCDFKNGTLAPLRGLDPVTAVISNGTKRIFLYENQYWFSWPNTAHFPVKSPIENDTYRRVYFSSHVGPRVTSNLIATGAGVMPANSYSLGVQQPLAPVGISGVTPGSGDPDETSDDETRYYTCTYVTEYAEEGPPASASAAVIATSPDSQVTLSLPIPPINIENLVSKRIYRTSGSTDDYYFVDEVPLAQASYVDAIPSDQLGDALETYDYFAPPWEMTGMTAMANGIMAGFVKNKLLFSEPYLPYAYPPRYTRSTEFDIVAIAPIRTSLVVATEGQPYIFSGVSPDAMSEDKLAIRQACVSSLSMVSAGDYVIYASPDGLVGITSTDARLLTEGVVTKRDWAAYQPETIHGYFYEGQYIAFYGDANNGGGFIYDIARKDFVALDIYASAGYSDTLTDTLYLVVDDQLYAFDSAAATLVAVWRSKIFDGADRAYRYLRLVCDTPQSVGVKIWVDGAMVFNRSASLRKIFKIPAARGRSWQVELTAAAPVLGFQLSPTAREV